jgi:hypothetical protein
MTVDKLALLTLAVVLIIGAFTNRIFYFGRMGGGSSGRSMPASLARLIMLIIASMLRITPVKARTREQRSTPSVILPGPFDWSKGVLSSAICFLRRPAFSFPSSGYRFLRSFL